MLRLTRRKQPCERCGKPWRVARHELAGRPFHPEHDSSRKHLCVPCLAARQRAHASIDRVRIVDTLDAFAKFLRELKTKEH